MPNVALPDGSRLYDHLRPGGLLISGREVAERVAGALPDVGPAPPPDNVPALVSPFAALFVRPDHVVALAAADGAEISAGSITRALGDAVGARVT